GPHPAQDENRGRGALDQARLNDGPVHGSEGGRGKIQGRPQGIGSSADVPLVFAGPRSHPGPCLISRDRRSADSSEPTRRSSFRWSRRTPSIEATHFTSRCYRLGSAIDRPHLQRRCSVIPPTYDILPKSATPPRTVPPNEIP